MGLKVGSPALLSLTTTTVTLIGLVKYDEKVIKIKLYLIDFFTYCDTCLDDL